MKKFDLLTTCANIALAFLLGMAGAGCLCTAFSLDVAPGNLLLACGLLAVGVAVLLRVRYGWLILCGLLLTWALHLRRSDVMPQMLSLLRTLLTCYRSAYGWQLPDFLASAPLGETTHAVCLIAGVCTLLAGIFLHLRRGGMALSVAVLPLIPCLVVTDTVPSATWLLILLLCGVLVLLSQKVRRRDAHEASRLVALLLVPVLLCSMLLFRLNPQESYKLPTEEGSPGSKLLHWLDSLPLIDVAENGEVNIDLSDLPTWPRPTVPEDPAITLPPLTVDIPIDPTFTVDPGLIDAVRNEIVLGNAGPRNPAAAPVITVSTSYRGAFYLRERGYDIYTGTSWKNSEAPQDMSVSAEYLRPDISLRVSTKVPLSYYYMPYYTQSGIYSIEKGYLENPRKLSLYTYRFSPLRSDWQLLWQQQSDAPIGQNQQHLNFTELPDDTFAQAGPILAELGITDATPVVDAAELIKAFVSSSATYDLDTGRMPEGETDFAMWFLKESDTGYCVHFASAATVLLRAAGIPARYVEGYIADISTSPTTITGDLAHAWVEYYVPDLGWVILEATPTGGDSPVPPETTGPTPPETTVPETTVPETTVPETTVPETTIPPATTVPEIVPPSATAPASQATVPTTGTPVSPPPHTQPTKIWAVLTVIFSLLCLICLAIGQWQLRLWWKQWYCSRGSTNRQTIRLWIECRRMARLRRQDAPLVLRDLAWKAAYSPYTITDEELQLLRDYLNRSIAHLKTRPWPLRLIYRLIFAAY